MRPISWILGLGIAALVACGVQTGPVDEPDESARMTTSLAQETSFEHADMTEPVGIASCFSECVTTCVAQFGCNSLPPDLQQQCGADCAEGCRCTCGVGVCF